ncbi:efflux RND transporter periplasmic adaptor subunit [Luteibacter yeojuensis]|uniref:Efflux RND transporter periplasmic adaptor subunit n=1 Tax=Luteibacter yeojuensis TaxID=345309 RepID=A0A7X5QXU4_9GAMM|nr:efflux RND transporter periplasmic adaptor subunit [Luteibacter yeojuensis]NID17346.1 efflux RND transporter periplasmic adaptor subunit [Luteibacter yeojuensis]
MNRSVRISLVALVLLAVATVAYFIGRHGATSSAPGFRQGAAKPSAKAPLYWYDPMVPEQHFDHPGLSPMGMEMIPKVADEGASGGVRIDAATRQSLGLRTALVERRVMASTVDVPGNVTWDARQAVTVSARVDGVVQRLDVRAPFTAVTQGAPLLSLLAPQWRSALAEAEALRHVQSPDARALREASQARLRVLGLPPGDRLTTGGDGAAILLHAPQAGIVTTLDVREGQRVSAGQTLMTINGIDTVWVEAAIPQGQLAVVHPGMPVSVRTDAWPGRAFAGKVETLLPDIDATTRAQRARIVLANPDGALVPGMFAHIALTGSEAAPTLVVPDEALIADGRGTRVIVAGQGERFHPTPVVTGRTAAGMTEIRDGLSAGQRIVVSGQFLIDSEANLSGALGRLEGASHPSSAPPPVAGEGDMSGMRGTQPERRP